MIPSAALPLLPMLVALQLQHWPSAPMPAFLASQIEAESRWRVKAELKSKREQGCGLAQFTRAYDARGGIRFDALAEAKKLHPELKGWSWQNCSDPKMQMTALVLTDRSLFTRAQPLGATPADALHMAVSAYNGGFGSILKDRTKCRMTKGCDPSKWYGNVERSSYKSQQPSIYGRSFFQINRDYVRNVVDVLRPKYDGYFQEKSP
jgi:hypothetical protein